MKLIKNIGLFILATVTFIVIFIVAIIREIIVTLTKKKNDVKAMFYGFYIGLSYLFYAVALTIDKTAALMFPSLWNAVFFNKNMLNTALLFGSDEAVNNKYAISNILGKNYIKDKNILNKFGLWFKEFLDLFEFDHIIKSI